MAEPHSRRHLAAGVLLGLIVAVGLGLGAYLLTGPFGLDPAPSSDPAASLDAPSDRKAEDTSRQNAEDEAKRQAEAEIKRLAEQEANRQAEAEARRLAEAQAAREAERRAELEVQRQAAEDAQRQADLDAQRRAEAEARRLADQESNRKAEAESRRLSQVEPFEKFLFAAKNTNVRTAPSVDSDKLAMISAGSGVTVTGGLPDGSWYRVRLANGADGFVWAKLLTREPPATSSTSVSARATTKSATTQATSADPEETGRRIAELERFIDANTRNAELAFRDFTTREDIFDHTERFRRVISFKDISFNAPQYKISVHYSYCYLKNGCQVLSDSGVFAAQFDGGKLTFLGEADAP